MSALAASFADHYGRKLAAWRRRLDALSRSGRRTVIWGGGSKGVTFLNVLKARSEIDCVVDINPAKQGMYVPGTGQPIVAPDSIRRRAPDTILVMNPLYEHEIAREAARLGLSAEIAVVQSVAGIVVLFAATDETLKILRLGGRRIIRVPNGVSPFAGVIRYGDLTHELAFTCPASVRPAYSRTSHMGLPNRGARPFASKEQHR